MQMINDPYSTSVTKVIPLTFDKVTVIDNFWGPKLTSWQTTLLRTCIDKCYESGRIRNFDIAAGIDEGDYTGPYFNDSDVYKVIEGAAYFISLFGDEALEKEIDVIIEKISHAQEPDGYLDTYYTIEAPEQKWTDMEKHEMYCGGHLIEAAIAYDKATHKHQLLDIAIRMANYYMEIFGTGKRHWVEGHEEIELALIKLAKYTGNSKYYYFAKWLLSERGHGYGHGMIWNRKEWGPAYCQDNVPVTEIKTAIGHSVRAMYLYTALSSLLTIEDNSQIERSVHNVWSDIATSKMYITGGVGASRENEGFKGAYFLPNESAYSETCASIGMVLFNQQLLQKYQDAKYADIIERCIYNSILSGISTSGDHFFYVNPLASIGQHHRSEWFGTSCCPTNLVRFLPSIGGLVAMENTNSVWLNQYIGSHFATSNGSSIEIKSDFPYQGNVTVKIGKVDKSFNLYLRKPSWSSEFRVRSTIGSKIEYEANTHYFVLTVDCDQVVELYFDNPVKYIHANTRVGADTNKVAVQQGPLIYCAEQIDNPNLYVDELKVSSDQSYEIKVEETSKLNHLLLNGRYGIIDMIPYFLWDNRNAGYMKVWLDQPDVDQILYC